MSESDNFGDGRRATKSFTTLGEHRKAMEERRAKMTPGEDYSYKQRQSLSAQIKLARINRTKGQGKFTRISDKALIAWERSAEQMQRDIYELRKHLHNGQALWEQGYKQVKRGKITEWVRPGWAGALHAFHKKQRSRR